MGMGGRKAETAAAEATIDAPAEEKESPASLIKQMSDIGTSSFDMLASVYTSSTTFTGDALKRTASAALEVGAELNGSAAAKRHKAAVAVQRVHRGNATRATSDLKRFKARARVRNMPIEQHPWAASRRSGGIRLRWCRASVPWKHTTMRACVAVKLCHRTVVCLPCRAADHSCIVGPLDLALCPRVRVRTVYMPSACVAGHDCPEARRPACAAGAACRRPTLGRGARDCPPQDAEPHRPCADGRGRCAHQVVRLALPAEEVSSREWAGTCAPTRGSMHVCVVAAHGCRAAACRMHEGEH